MSPAPADPAADTSPDDTGEDAGAQDETDNGEDGEDEGGPEDEDESDEDGVVIAIIKAKTDGSYVLIAGDEDEGEEGGEGEDEESAAGDGTTAVEGEQPSEPEEQTFDSTGAVMKGVLELLKAHEAENGGEEAGFDEGYKADKSPTVK